MSFSFANQSIGPADGPSIVIAAPAGGVIDSIAYHKTADDTDSITRNELASVALHKLTNLDETAYSFLVKGKKSDGTALSTSLSGSPVSAPSAPVVNSCQGLEQSLSANITVAEAGDLLFFLIDAAGAILEISKPSSEAGSYELLLSDGLVEGASYEVSVMLKVARGFSSVSNTQAITMSNIPDGIAVSSHLNHSVDGQDIHLVLAVAQPDDYAADFKLEAEVSTAKEWTEQSILDAVTITDPATKTVTRAADSDRLRFGTGLQQNQGDAIVRFRNDPGYAMDLGGLDPVGMGIYVFTGQSSTEGYSVERLGKVSGYTETIGTGTFDLSDGLSRSLSANALIFVIDDMEVTTEVKQLSPGFVRSENEYRVGASAVIDSLGDFASVKLRWTNDQGSSAYSSAFLMHNSYTNPLMHPTSVLKVTPSIADKVLSFAVSARDGALGLKSASYVFGGVSKTHQVNATDGRIVKSFPADQDLSAISASQAISAKLEYETGADAQFEGQLNIPRIEAGEVSIDATEVFSEEGAKVEFSFADSSSYIDGASRTSVTINETAIISEQAFIPANASGSTDFQLKSVQYSLPAASIAATDSMDALSGVTDWQSMPIKQVEVFGKDLTLNEATAVGDFFINFDLSVKMNGTLDGWEQKSFTEALETIEQLDAAYGAQDWYISPTASTLNNVPLKYEDGELYFVELSGSSWSMYYLSGSIIRTNMSGAVSDGQLTLPEFGGRKIWNTTTLYNGYQAPVPLAEGTEFPARKFILDRTVHTHTAVSPPTAATLVISADGNEGRVTASITPGSTGNQDLYDIQVRYTDENGNSFDRTASPYAVEAGPGVKVTAVVFDSYRYTKANGEVDAHVVTSDASNEAHGTTAPILGAVSIVGKQLSINYKSGGKIGEDHKLSLFVFAIDSDVSPADVTSGSGSFHEIKSITPQSLTAEVTYAADFSHFSSDISKYMVVLSRASDNTAASADGM